MQFVVVCKHSPELCPTSNAKIRQLLREAASKMPTMAKELGIQLITLNFFGGDHEIIFVIESAEFEQVRTFITQNRFIQWNTVSINPTWSLEEVLSQADNLPTIF